MRGGYMLAVAAALLACVVPANRFEAAALQAGDGPLREQMRHLAEALIPAHAGKDQDRDLAALFQLQLVAGRYREAEATLDSLSALRRVSNIRGAWRLVPWRIYANAKRRESQSGTPLGNAFEEAFQEVHGALDDKTAVELPPWFVVNAPAARQQLAEAVRPVRTPPHPARLQCNCCALGCWWRRSAS